MHFLGETAVKAAILSIFSASSWCAVLLLPQSVDAQLIQVRPGFVKAPFVRVINYADGSSYVRAPFVSIRSPPRGFPATAVVVQERHAISRSNELDLPGSPLIDSEGRPLRQFALEQLRVLERTVDREWQEYLHLDALAQLLGASDDEFLVEDQRRHLSDLLRDYEATSNSENAVSKLASFRMLHVMLLRLVLPPKQRGLDELTGAKRQLDAELGRIHATEIWGPYLELPITRVSQRQGIPVPPDHGEEAAKVEQALSRYDLAMDDPQYQLITSLPGFQMTRNKLASYLQLLKPPIDTSTPEQLPLPDPQLDDLRELSE